MAIVTWNGRSSIELSMTPEQFLAYESRLKYIMDEEAKKEGMKSGLKRGSERCKKKAIELIARRLLSNGAEIQYVMEITDLAKEEVIAIRKSLEE